jgi:hypothetical protein
VFLEPVARLLLIVHATVGFTALFSATHLAVYATLHASGRKRPAQLLRFGWIAPLAVGVQIFLGLILYPTYRVRVRGAHFDREGLQWVSSLFDFKEHAAALALPLVLTAALIGRRLVLSDRRHSSASGPGQEPGAFDDVVRIKTARSVAALSLSGATLIWAVALIGLYVTARHPVGTP